MAECTYSTYSDTARWPAGRPVAEPVAAPKKKSGLMFPDFRVEDLINKVEFACAADVPYDLSFGKTGIPRLSTPESRRCRAACDYTVAYAIIDFFRQFCFAPFATRSQHGDLKEFRLAFSCKGRQ